MVSKVYCNLISWRLKNKVLWKGKSNHSWPRIRVVNLSILETFKSHHSHLVDPGPRNALGKKMLIGNKRPLSLETRYKFKTLISRYHILS